MFKDSTFQDGIQDELNKPGSIPVTRRSSSNGSVGVSAPGCDVRSNQGAENKPPSSNRGVEFRVDWLTITIWLPLRLVLDIYEKNFRGVVGNLDDRSHGGFGYTSAKAGMGGFMLYYNPEQRPGEKVAGDENRVTMKFPGQVCAAVSPEKWIEFFNVLDQDNVPCHFTRIDLAFDNVPFTPGEFFKAVESDDVRSLAKRESLRFEAAPMQKKDDGSGVGCYTCYFGSRSSQRMVRVYDKRGPTRLELECKDDRSHLIALELFRSKPEDWFGVAISHVRDFIDVNCQWWGKFINGIERAFAKISDLKKVTLDRIVNWIDGQVAPSLSVLIDCLGFDTLKEIIEGGKKRRSSKYQGLVLAMAPA